MKKKTVKKTTIYKSENIELDYENGFKCCYTVNNDELANYQFINKDGLIYNYCKSLNLIKNKKINEIYNIFIDKTKFTIDELINFNEFDKLYVLDDKIKILTDYKGNIIPIIIGLFSYEKLEKDAENLLNSINRNFICDASIENSIYQSHPFFVSYNVLLPDDIYIGFATKYRDTGKNMIEEIINYIKIK